MKVSAISNTATSTTDYFSNDGINTEAIHTTQDGTQIGPLYVVSHQSRSRTGELPGLPRQDMTYSATVGN